MYGFLFVDEEIVINDYDKAFNDDQYTIVETIIGEDEYETGMYSLIFWFLF